MAKISFFTQESAIAAFQTPETAFGPQAETAGLDKYNLDNRFSVNIDAPAYAITKSMVFAVPDSNSADLLNIALLPLNQYTLGFPIKFFIYRGIKKSSLVDNSDNIVLPDSTWKTDNILKVIGDMQTKINTEKQTNLTAKSSALGLHLSTTVPNDTLLEKIFFDPTSDFHPIIINEGCQLGEFSGGEKLAGIEVIMDMIGYDATLSLLKLSSHQLQVEKPTITGSMTPKQELAAKFKARFKREEILNYLDITAFYGSAKNQGYKITETDKDNVFLSKFHNRNIVYIDIRDERGFSYNHFYQTEDNIRIGFYSADTAVKEPVFAEVNYYESGWPLLKLTDKTYNTSKNHIFLKLPILAGYPENLNFISCYNSKIRTENNVKWQAHNPVAININSAEIPLKQTENIICPNWRREENKLGASYLLMKKSVIGNSADNTYTSSVWNNFFSLKMTDIWKIDNNAFDNGVFCVRTYSSLNFPAVVNPVTEEAYYTTAGIAIDKGNVNFFAYKDMLIYEKATAKKSIPQALTGTNIFKRPFNTDDYDYSGMQNPSIGFLNLFMSDETGSGNFELAKFTSADADTNTQMDFLGYRRIDDTQSNDEVINTLQVITLKKEEYNALKAIQENGAAEFPNHPFYLKETDIQTTHYAKFSYLKRALTLGVPTVTEDEEDPTLVSLDLLNYPQDILVANKKITLVSVNYN